ncbi:MAG: CoA pyrophosphatase [Mesorhizobium sp.]|nr:CoA pyrophosphatase [Mesorhizobium sp.]
MFDRLRVACTGFEREQIDCARGLTRAAVGIVVVDMEDETDEAGFLLTLRAASLRAHAGQYALPGGRIDAGETAVDTVIRECFEELGLVLSHDDVVGVLDDYATLSGYAITPVVVAMTATQAIAANPHEVAGVYRIALRAITRDGAARFRANPDSGGPILSLALAEDVSGDYDVIHAPTAAILFQFAELLSGRTTRVSGFGQPAFARK